MWEAWQISKLYGVIPSELYGIDDPLTAFCFNRAIGIFGSTVDAEIEQAGANAKTDRARQMSQNMVLVKWIPELQAGKFRTPKATR